MSRSRIALGFTFAALLVASLSTANSEGDPAEECGVAALETLALPHCTNLTKTTALYNAALGFERSGHRQLAVRYYSDAIAHAKRPIELFLAGTTPESAKRRRGVMHRELGELSEAMADFIALIDADHGNAEARYERARTLLELGRPSDALVDADVGAWLRPYTADFHSLRAQILGRLGRNEEAAAATAQSEKYSPPSELTELGRVLRGIGLITPEDLQELRRYREATNWELALRGIVPNIIRQHFMLQKGCPSDDRHALAFRVDTGRISAKPSYAGPAGTIMVEEGETLAFTLGAEPCQVRVVVGKGNLATDTPPTQGERLGGAPSRNIGSQTVERAIYPSSATGCARGSADVRAYWGSVDHTSWRVQSRVKARFDEPVPPPSKQFLFNLPFGDEPCRITIQVWKAG